MPHHQGRRRRPAAGAILGLADWDLVDRREHPRHPATDYRAWLGWWDGEEFVTLAARLLDIARGGVALLVPAGAGPRARSEVWFCLHADRRTACLAGTVAGSALSLPGHERVRMAFRGRCPQRLLELATRWNWEAVAAPAVGPSDEVRGAWSAAADGPAT